MTVVRGIAGLAAVVFIICPLRTVTLVLAFLASVAVFLICHTVLLSLDSTYADKYHSGYWPKPSDWTAPPISDDASHKRVDVTKNQ